MRKILLATLVFMLLSIVSLTQAQECSPEIDVYIELLNEANQEIENGNVDMAIDILQDVNNRIELAQTSCVTTLTEDSTNRVSPAPFGTAVTGNNYTFQMTAYDGDAAEWLAENDYYTTEVEEGYRYVYVEFDVTCDKPLTESCEIFIGNLIKLVGDSGTTINDDTRGPFVDTPNSHYAEMFGGSTARVATVFEVPIDETGILVWADSSGDLWFAPPSE